MTKTSKFRPRVKLLAALLTLAAAPLAQAWTNKPVKIIVAAPAVRSRCRR